MGIQPINFITRKYVVRNVICRNNEMCIIKRMLKNNTGKK